MRDVLKTKREHEMTKAFKTFMKDESGATAIEYGLIASLIAVAIIGALVTLGTSLSGIFGTVSSEL
jgi:pilus assembly protein Flp/PilA